MSLTLVKSTVIITFKLDKHEVMKLFGKIYLLKDDVYLVKDKKFENYVTSVEL